MQILTKELTTIFAGNGNAHPEKTWMEYAWELALATNFPGYKPEIVEIPNGDGVVDSEKRYFHISTKYLRDEDYLFRTLYEKVFDMTLEAFDRMFDSPIFKGFAPSHERSALRIIHYPPGAVTHPHKDFSFITWALGSSEGHKVMPEADGAIKVSSGATLPYRHGEILEAVDPFYEATKHYSLPSTTDKYSAVFFTMPDREAVLPSGDTVGEWLEERIARSRKEMQKY